MLGLSPKAAPVELRYAATTDVGRKRAHNEDNYLIDPNLRLFLVADGMGGHASGEIASAMAVHTVRDIVADARDVLDAIDESDASSHMEVCTLLEYAVHRACETIYEKARLEPEKKGMGTTLVVLLLLRERGYIAYVGDSRIYLLRGGIVYQLTEDHSLSNELIRQGKLRADEIDESPYAKLKTAMTRAVGPSENVEVDTLDFDMIPGDAFLLCSDGLYEYVGDEDITRVLGNGELDKAPGRFVDIANSKGGKDNITAMTITVEGNAGDSERAAEVNRTLETLRQVPLCRDLSHQQLVRMMNMTSIVHVAGGQDVFREGDDGDQLFVIVSGAVEMRSGETPVAHCGPGDHFGEMALLDSSPRSATARAVEPTKLLAVSRSDFYQVLRKEPPLAVKLLWNFLSVLAQRLRRTTSDLVLAKTEVLEDLSEDLFDD